MDEDNGILVFGDIEDVGIIIKINGKHYLINNKDTVSKEQAKKERVACFNQLLSSHYIVNQPLDTLIKEQNKITVNLTPNNNEI